MGVLSSLANIFKTDKEIVLEERKKVLSLAPLIKELGQIKSELGSSLEPEEQATIDNLQNKYALRAQKHAQQFEEKVLSSYAPEQPNFVPEYEGQTPFEKINMAAQGIRPQNVINEYRKAPARQKEAAKKQALLEQIKGGVVSAILPGMARVISRTSSPLDALQETGKAVERPVIPLSKLGIMQEKRGFTPGLIRGFIKNIEALSSPENAGLMIMSGALPGMLGRLSSGLFFGDMAKNTAKNVAEFLQASRSKKWDKAGFHLAGAITNGYFTAKSGLHAAGVKSEPGGKLDPEAAAKNIIDFIRKQPDDLREELLKKFESIPKGGPEPETKDMTKGGPEPETKDMTGGGPELEPKPKTVSRTKTKPRTKSLTIAGYVKKLGGIKPTKDFPDLPFYVKRRDGRGIDDIAKTMILEGVLPRVKDEAPSQTLYRAILKRERIDTQEHWQQKFDEELKRKAVEAGPMPEEPSLSEELLNEKILTGQIEVPLEEAKKAVFWALDKYQQSKDDYYAELLGIKTDEKDIVFNEPVFEKAFKRLYGQKMRISKLKKEFEEYQKFHRERRLGPSEAPEITTEKTIGKDQYSFAPKKNYKTKKGIKVVAPELKTQKGGLWESKNKGEQIGMFSSKQTSKRAFKQENPYLRSGVSIDLIKKMAKAGNAQAKEALLYLKATGKSYDLGGYARIKEGEKRENVPNSSRLKLPEIVEIVSALRENTIKLKNLLPGKALGVFDKKRGDIYLLKDLPIGEPLDRYLSKTPLKDKKMAAKKYGINDENEIHIVNRKAAGGRGWEVSVYRKDPTIASKTLGHEFGHLADWINYKKIPSERVRNMLGKIGSLKKYLLKTLSETPGGRALSRAEEKALIEETKRLATIDAQIKAETVYTPQQILAIWNSLEENIPKDLLDWISRISAEEKKAIIKAAMKGKGLTLKKEVPLISLKKRIEKAFIEEARKRKLFDEYTILKELKELTAIWRPYDKNVNPEYTKYRQSLNELYADAISVLFNAPELLDKHAPMFKRAFLNYLNKKPDFFKIYDDLQNIIAAGPDVLGETRRAKIRQMFEREERIRQKLSESPQYTMGFFENLHQAMVDERGPLYKLLNKTSSKKIDEYKAQLESTAYISGPIYIYLADVRNKIIEVGKKAGLGPQEIGELLFLKRVETERKYLWNPRGFDAETALEQVGYIKRSMGEKRWNILKKMVTEFWKIRNEHVIPALEASEMLNPALLKKIKENPNYAYFNVLDFLETRLGKGSANIYFQTGTLSDVGNPFTNTVMKDAALIRAAEWNATKKPLMEFLLNTAPPEYGIKPAERVLKTTGKGEKFLIPQHRETANETTIYWMDKGKIKAAYLPKAIARGIQTDWNETGALYNAMQSVLNLWRSLYVGKNPFWAFTNLQRDLRGAATRIKGASLLGKFDYKRLAKARNVKEVKEAFVPGMIYYLAKSIPEAKQDAFNKISSATVRDLYKNRALLIQRKYKAAAYNRMAEYDALMESFSLSPEKYKNNVIKTVAQIGNGLESFGKLSERATKIAVAKWLKAHGSGSVNEKMRILRTMGGSPDFLRRGTLYRFYNNLFFFSNAGKEGWRSNIEAFKAGKMEYIWKTFKYDLLPKIAMYAASRGYITQIAQKIGDERLEKYGEWVQRAMGGIPEHDKTNYLCIPISITEGGKTVYLILPHDFTGQVLAGMTWKMLTQKESGDIVNYVAGGLPYEGKTPIWELTENLVSYVRNRNPIDPYYGREMVNSRSWEAGGKTRAKAFGKALWNRYGGGIFYRFPYETIPEAGTALEDFLKVPGLRRFVRISDRGRFEELKAAGATVLSDLRKREIIERREIIKHLGGENITYKNMHDLFVKLKKTGVIPGRRKFSQFREKYIGLAAVLTKKNHKVLFLALSRARSLEARQKILEKYYNKTHIEKRQVPYLLRKIKQEILK